MNKRLLIGAAFVVCLGNIKVSPFLARSDRGSLPVWPSVVVATATPLKRGKKTGCCFG